MKTANQIISHLKSKPYLKNLQHVDCYNKLLSLLPKSIKTYTRFIYQKNDTLFFVLEHPGIKMEFNYKSNLIKSILNKLIEVDIKCNFMKSSHIKAFVTNKSTLSQIKDSKNHKLQYAERATGEFENSAQNEEIREILEKIRENIKSNTNEPS
jgi:L-rhamnose mutarotase